MSLAAAGANGGGVGRGSRLGRLAGFTVFAAAGALMLAGAVLLPEYAALAALRARRDVVAHHVNCEERLAAYYERMIRAVRNDPVLVTRLMIRHGNYRPIGCQSMEVESASPERSVPERLLHEARNPPAPEDRPLVRAGLWMAEADTSGLMVLLGLAMLAAGAALFGWRRRPTDEFHTATG